MKVYPDANGYTPPHLLKMLQDALEALPTQKPPIQAAPAKRKPRRKTSRQTHKKL